jgi:hypothetical protein
MALPFLEAMRPTRAHAQAATAQRFFGFFYPNGVDPSRWDPTAGALSAASLPECLQDLNGFAAEGIWPAGDAILNDVTVVTGIDHSGVSTDIHVPSMAFSAYKGVANNYTPPEPTLDQYLADHLRGETPYRNLALSATPSNDVAQGILSFKAGGQPETITRNPRQLFDTLFGGGTVGMMDDPAAVAARARQQSVLDLVRGDAQRLNQRLGTADRQRLDQYLTSVEELEVQINAMPPSSCTSPAQPASGGNWHGKAKAFVDLAVIAMACDLTRVALLQYSDSWGVNYSDYSIGSGIESLGTWSDHFISHKLDDTDRATDLDGIDRTEAMRVANVRVVNTSRFKVRRFAYLVNALKSVQTANGTLLDECLVLYASENGDGDSHARKRMPTMIAGRAGGFQTGRAVAAANKTTGALHASLIQRFGIPIETYGTGGGTPIAEL